MRTECRSRRYLALCLIAWLASVAGTLPLSTVYADDGLVAHYTFDEGPGQMVKDHSGNGNTGKIIGDVAYVKLDEGKGYAMRFNAGNSYVDCGKKPSLDLTDAVTIELWLYPETSPNGGAQAGLVGKGLGSYHLSYVSSGGCWWYIGGTKGGRLGHDGRRLGHVSTGGKVTGGNRIHSRRCHLGGLVAHHSGRI